LDVFIFSFLLTLFLTPIIRKLSLKFNIVDTPTKRKVHEVPIPRLGGIAMYLSFVATLLLRSSLDNTMQGIILGSFILFVLGTLDDICKKGIPAPIKLIAQIFSAWVVVHFFDVRIEFITNPFTRDLIFFDWLEQPLTIFWIVGIINAINLIDGLDGLAAGVGSIAAFTLFVVAILLGRFEVAILLLALFGVTLGFLRYNFSPASIFMGDTGSMFLGYILAVASVHGVLKSTASMALAIPLLALGIPIADTVLAIFRRLRNKQHIFKPDSEHLHHQLLLFGFSHKQVVLLIYYISIILGLGALLLALTDGLVQIVIFLVIFVFILYGILVFKDTKKKFK